MHGFKAAKRMLRRLDARWLSGGRMILLYHRVAKVDSDPWSLCVSPEHFAEHLDVLRRYGPCMTVRDMARLLDEGGLPRRAVAVTFDDGYADNLHCAKPLLERHDIPATFFLSSRLLDPAREFWWDELERILLQPGMLPPGLELTVDGHSFRRRLTAAASCTDEAFRRYRAWKAWEPPPTERHALYLELWSLLRPLPASVQRSLLDELASWAAAGPAARAGHRPLSDEEAAALGEGDSVEIGAHSLTHLDLPEASVELQRYEIAQSKADCEALWGRAVTSFSYPFGRASAEAASLVREAGFACACSTRSDVVRRGADRFHLPRVQVLDWDGEEFARRLACGFVH